jgi:hypothetical protein
VKTNKIPLQKLKGKTDVRHAERKSASQVRVLKFYYMNETILSKLLLYPFISITIDSMNL